MIFTFCSGSCTISYSGLCRQSQLLQKARGMGGGMHSVSYAAFSGTNKTFSSNNKQQKLPPMLWFLSIYICLFIYFCRKRRTLGLPVFLFVCLFTIISINTQKCDAPWFRRLLPGQAETSVLKRGLYPWQHIFHHVYFQKYTRLKPFI